MTSPDYAAVWQEFVMREQTGSIFSGYHITGSGPVPMYNLGIRIIDQALIAWVQEVQNALIGLPDVALHPAGWLHVTVNRLGSGPGLNDDPDIHPEDLPPLITQIAAALADVPPFNLELRNVNAFPSVLFIEAHDGGAIADIRNRLAPILPQLPNEPAIFIPHLSIAAFNTPTAIAPIVERIAHFHEFVVGMMRVDCLQLTYIPLEVAIATRNIFVPETHVAEFRLRG